MIHDGTARIGDRSIGCVSRPTKRAASGYS